jgi:hypothetical protein
MIDNRYNTFDKNWFDKYQTILLILLNFPILKIFIRKKLGINKDIKYFNIIRNIQPNSYSVYLGNNKNKAYIVTHNKFSKKIYFSLKHIWLFLHWVDSIFLDEYIPELSFGFNTLDVYPEAGEGGGNTTCDGYVMRERKSENFATIRTGAGTYSTAIGNYIDTLLSSDANTDNYDSMSRGILTFNTSLILNSYTITSVNLYLRGNVKNDGLGKPDLSIVTPSPANNNTLAISDYNIINWGMTEIGGLLYDSYRTDQYNGIVISTSSIVKEGITPIGVVLSWDQSDTEPSWSSNVYSGFSCFAADDGDDDKDPYLTIAYTAGYKWSAMIL